MNKPNYVALALERILRLITSLSLLVFAGMAVNASAQTVTTLYSFDNSSLGVGGGDPVAGLTQGSDGNFYGTTYAGGSNGCGTVFRICSDGSYTTLHSFAGPPKDGDEPEAALAQGSDGNFYGTTYAGGRGTGCGLGCGTVFRMSPSGSLTNLHSFANSPDDGGQPLAALVQGNDGNFYGTATSGGTSNFGTVFRISPGRQPNESVFLCRAAE